jgi:hypothetical protein
MGEAMRQFGRSSRDGASAENEPAAAIVTESESEEPAQSDEIDDNDP